MIALITGASSGIGREFAHSLAARGIHLIITARRKERLLELKKEITSIYGVRVKVIQADLSKAEECYRLFEATKPVLPDILINNAGFGLYGHFETTDLDTELEMIDVNIRALHILTKLFYQSFAKRNSGYILNVASIAGFMAGPEMSTYYATKNYVLQLSKALYQEAKDDHRDVSVSVLCPGPVKTEFNQVSGAKFIVSGLEPEQVAEYAISGMFQKKLILIPGNEIKALSLLARWMPTKPMLKLTAFFQNKRHTSNLS